MSTQTPKYDNDYITLGYLNKILEENKKSTSNIVNQIPKNYGTTPITPYYKNSLLLQNGVVYKCIASRMQGNFSWDDWAIVATDNSSLNNFIESTYNTDKIEIEEQIDQKVETHYQNSDPALEWDSPLLKEKHVGDFWYNTSSKTQWRYTKITDSSPISYKWNPVDLPTSIYDLINNKKSIYISKPSSYKANDLWIIESDLNENDLPIGTTENPIEKGDWVFALYDNTEFDKTDWVKKDEKVNSSYLESHYYTSSIIDEKVSTLNESISSSITQGKEDILLEVSQSYSTKSEVTTAITDFDEQISTVTESVTTNSNSISDLIVQKDSIVSRVSSTESQINSINDNVSNNIYTKEQSNELIQNATEGLTNKLSTTGGQNLLYNTALSNITDNQYDYWIGSAEKVSYDQAVSLTAIKLKNDSFKQNLTLKNGTYAIGLKYIRLLSTATASVKFNGKTLALGESGTIESSIDISTSSFELAFICDTDDGYLIYDIMLNSGTENIIWSQSANEINTDTVSIGKGVNVKNSNMDTDCTINADGVRVRNYNTNTDVMKTTDKGGVFEDVQSKTATLGGLSIKSVNRHTKIVGVNS